MGDCVVVIRSIERLALLATLVAASCRDASSSVFPATPLGRMGRDWLTAHNRGEGHAIVHFTMVNRGTAPMSGAQTDSAVYAGVQLARQLGPLVAIEVLQSSDSLLAVLLQSADTSTSTWTAQFAPARQPSPVKVVVQVVRTWIYHGGSDLGPP